jgi:hypothetical protein
MMCLYKTSSSIGLLRKATAPERSACDLSSGADCKREQLEGKLQERHSNVSDDVRGDVDDWYNRQSG